MKLLDEQDRPRTEEFIARQLGREVSLQLEQLVKEGKVHKTRSGNWTLYEPIETPVIE